ncbi:MAG: hypothetical protein WBV27_01890, partial [Trichococcus sp.]|uniref:hypothetical protein n=1 Tax=Trichococcus sp. TaxID=1985464 RepID=UPI003C6A6231
MNRKQKLYGSTTFLSLLLLFGCTADDDAATNDSSASGSTEVTESSSEAEDSSEQDESIMEDSEESDMEEDESIEAPYIYGAVGALADNDLTMEEMFTYAIQDEQLAHGEYAYVLGTFGDQAPFNNIVSAEAQHVSEMTVLFEKYDLAVPADESADHLKQAA